MNTSQFCHCSVGMMNRSHCGNERERERERERECACAHVCVCVCARARDGVV